MIIERTLVYYILLYYLQNMEYIRNLVYSFYTPYSVYFNLSSELGARAQVAVALVVLQLLPSARTPNTETPHLRRLL